MQFVLQGGFCTAPVICTELPLQFLYVLDPCFMQRLQILKAKWRWEGGRGVCTENLPDASGNWILVFRKAGYWQRGWSGPSDFNLPHTLPLKQLLKVCELQLLVYGGGKK